MIIPLANSGVGERPASHSERQEGDFLGSAVLQEHWGATADGTNPASPYIYYTTITIESWYVRSCRISIINSGSRLIEPAVIYGHT